MILTQLLHNEIDPIIIHDCLWGTTMSQLCHVQVKNDVTSFKFQSRGKLSGITKNKNESQQVQQRQRRVKAKGKK